MSPRVQHPKWESILAHVESGGDATVAEHCERCSDCARIAEALRGLLSTLEDSRLPVVPPALVERTLASLSDSPLSAGTAALGRGPDVLWRDWLARLGRPVRELLAALSADSLQPSPALRGSSQAVPRMLYYEAEDCRVILEFSGESSRPGKLTGQIALASGRALEKDARVLVAEATGIVQYGVDPDGSFAIEPFAEGSKELSLLLGERLIRVVLPG